MRLNKKKKLDWTFLWINKSDYISEYYVNIKGKYKMVDESIDYFITMIEMAIYYLKDFSEYYDYVYVQHEIIIDNKVENKEDIRERDFAEYLKYLFYKEYDIEYIYKLIDKNNDRFNYYIVFARLLFPSYYLFYLERVIVNNSNYEELISIVKKISEYEEFLKRISYKMNDYLMKKIILPF